ncbi:MAG TPA: 2-dehydro-3-deoxyphosphogluconate aldolase [Thermoanaerobaculia bacterium]|nr:2-dehydro-3-deoxyphosphogluconate aldolase [Thermoanaerobaculia bacterium]
MTTATPSPTDLRARVRRLLEQVPLVGVVRTGDAAEAERQARMFAAGGIRWVEVTFTVPRAADLVRKLLADRGEAGGIAPETAIGMGTVTGAGRAREAVAAGAEFLVSPNASAEVAAVGHEADLPLVLGALTPTEIVTAHGLGAHLVKVFPLPPVGGPAYLGAVRGPLGDIPMLASGGFGPEEIPAYRAAGASAFGIGAPLLAEGDEETVRRVAGAVALARGADPAHGHDERAGIARAGTW